MFETDVTAHYITNDPTERVRQYIDFAAILNKRKMDVCKQHRNSKDPQWHEAMDILWQNHWAHREQDVIVKFNRRVDRFTRVNRNGKTAVVQNWAGKTLRLDRQKKLSTWRLTIFSILNFPHLLMVMCIWLIGSFE